jgi:ribosomal protein S18 acetylase RimI-like enzyme
VSIQIRSGVASDAAALAELAERTFRETFAADNKPDDLELYVSHAYGTAQQLCELTDPSIRTIVVEIEGSLAGYAQLRTGDAPDCVRGPSPIELMRFYVAQAWHGRGIAQDLMKRVEQVAHEREARTLWLGVWERNERAKAFYRKIGFRDVGSHVFVVGTDPQIDRIMVRPLDGPTQE